MSPIACVILALGAIGHVVLWVALVNRIHALGIKRIWVDVLTLFSVAVLGTMPIYVLATLAGYIPYWPRAAWTYLILCAGILVAAVIQRLNWHLRSDRRFTLLSNSESLIKMPDAHLCLAPGIPTWLGMLPGNEVVTMRVQEKSIAIPRLSRTEAPLRIAHLTDLHMSGRITRKYFERVVEETNALNADIVAITGDIVDREHCVDWIPTTLGRLQAAHGVYYVLGNHDRHVKIPRLKAALATAGLVHLGGITQSLSIRGLEVTLGGNELPWFQPASDFSAAPKQDVPGSSVRILLAHSPDEFEWAQQNDVDLILAGHLHGGQIRMPLLGAIASPSRYGVRYAFGVFSAGNTVMHVSRGTASLTPLRYNCPPEIALLTLKSPQLT